MARDLRNTGAADRLGRFGEGLVAYILMRKGYEIAFIGDLGADLIASKEGKRFAISVKTRLFREDSQESRMLVIEDTHLGKLNVFADQYGLQPLFAHVVSLAREGTIQSFIMYHAD